MEWSASKCQLRRRSRLPYDPISSGNQSRGQLASAGGNHCRWPARNTCGRVRQNRGDFIEGHWLRSRVKQRHKRSKAHEQKLNKRQRYGTPKG
jgi:hypothetical protein